MTTIHCDWVIKVPLDLATAKRIAVTAAKEFGSRIEWKSAGIGKIRGGRLAASAAPGVYAPENALRIVFGRDGKGNTRIGLAPEIAIPRRAYQLASSSREDAERSYITRLVALLSRLTDDIRLEGT